MSTEFQFSQVLQKTQEVEYALWCVLGNFGEGSFSDLQGSPINGVAVGALKEFLEKPSDLMVGIIPFYVKNFFPFTAEACNSGCHTLEEALFWADKQNSLSSPEVESPLQTFSRKYLLEAAKLALISPVGAQICFGIDHVSARALFRAGFDRWSVEILVRHFNLRFSLSGSDEALWDEFRDPVQVALVDWLLTSPKQRLVQREKFLRTVFRFAGWSNADSRCKSDAGLLCRNGGCFADNSTILAVVWHGRKRGIQRGSALVAPIEVSQCSQAFAKCG